MVEISTASADDEALPVVAPEGASAPSTAPEEDAPLPKGATRLADGSVVLPLRYPASVKYRDGATGEVREEVTSSLTFRRLTGADLRAIQGAPRESMALTALARSTGLGAGRAAILYDAMDAADLLAASRVVEGFLGVGQPTTA